MKWASMLFMALTAMAFANDTFTAEETDLIDGQIKTAVTKKFTLQYLKQIEKNAASKYLLFKVGDKFTSNSPGRNFTGTIHIINKLTVRVGDFLINKNDYPGYYFDATTNARMRKVYVSKYYHQAKNSYRQRAGEYYRNKILAKRPPSERPAITQQPVIAVKPQPIKPQQSVEKPIAKVTKKQMTKPNVKIKATLTAIERYSKWIHGKWYDYEDQQIEYTFTDKFISIQKFGDPKFANITGIKDLKRVKNTNQEFQIVISTKGINNLDIHWIVVYNNGRFIGDELLVIYRDGIKGHRVLQRVK